MLRKILCILFLLLAGWQSAMAQHVSIHAHNFTTRDGLGSNVVNCGIQDQQGYIWLGTNQGLSRFDGHRFDNFYIETDGERQMESVTHMVEDTLDKVLIMTGKDYRLLCFDLRKMCFVEASGRTWSEPSNEAKEPLFIAKAKRLGIQRGNIINHRHDLHYAALANGQEVYTTIDNGFYFYDPRTSHLQHFSCKDERPIIQSDCINDVFVDRSGSVWLATTYAGIYQLDFNEEDLVYHPLDGSSGSFRSFSQLKGGAIAVGDMDGNVFRYDPKSRTSQLLFRKGARTYAMRTDQKGRFWVATRGDGVWVDNRHLNETDGLTARQIFDICLSKDGTAWIGTFDEGLIEAKEGSDGKFTYRRYLPDEKIHQMLFDHRGCLWIGTENGLFCKEGKRFIPHFQRGKVVCLTEGPDGTLYATSNGYGLLIIQGDELSYFTTSNGLSNNSVEAVVVDKNGLVIAATDQGVSIINRKDGTVRNVYSPLGLIADTYNEDAILRTTDGRIFLGSQRGMAELQHRAEPSSRKGWLAPLLSSIEVNDSALYDKHLLQTLRLAHNQNNLRFHFSSFAYKDLSSTLYSYQLEGVDHDWRPSTQESHALYTDLRPGHYRFRVRYSLSGGAWSEETICEVYIAQPWYWTWCARLSYLLLTVIIVWFQWRQYQQRLSLRRQLDQRLTSLYVVEAQQKNIPQESATTMDTEQNDSQEGETKVRERLANERNKDFLDRLDRLILRNLQQTDLDVNFLAQEMCVSYSTLHRRIKSLTGMPANEYVRKHRLAKSMQLLREGINVTEVSMECGFSSPSYFTRCFKQEYGLLPSEV